MESPEKPKNQNGMWVFVPEGCKFSIEFPPRKAPKTVENKGFLSKKKKKANERKLRD